MPEFLFGPDFLKDFNALEEPIRLRIREKLRFFSEQENPLLFAKKIKGHKNIYRFRVGDFRIIFRTDTTNIILLLVKHRKDIDENL